MDIRCAMRGEIILRLSSIRVRNMPIAFLNISIEHCSEATRTKGGGRQQGKVEASNERGGAFDRLQ
jgi:hypothetical protein